MVKGKDGLFAGNVFVRLSVFELEKGIMLLSDFGLTLPCLECDTFVSYGGVFE